MSRFISRPAGPVSEQSVSELGWQRWRALAEKEEYAAIASWIVGDTHTSILDNFFHYSPYLTNLALLHPDVVYDVLTYGGDKAFETAIAGIIQPEKPEAKYQTIKYQLRIAKRKVALITAICDITKSWSLEQITRSLSEFADISLKHTLDAILLMGHERGEIVLKNLEKPEEGSGIIVLGMGKLGGFELNYSSDIDLIIFFRKNRLEYIGRQTEQHFMNKLAQDLVQIMQDRTAEGYVFRTDLRLRPDPASTPPAINTQAAYYYYESVGQNWERAAMIKARPVAGDIPAGNLFLERLAPFMWRRSLDFAAIKDIHSIKRQMDSRQNPEIHMPGHNVKLGIGGIREIEFYAHIFQLIWGGREVSLRSRATRTTLKALLDFNLIDRNTYQILHDAYVFLRTLEHRLQMVADEQTHTIPESSQELARLAAFIGYADATALEKDFLHHTRAVHNIYARSFRSAERLGSDGNLVFTGVSHDPETLRTLERMGFTQPETVSEVVMGWHHGSCRATRTKQARELLTELMPTILARLAETANPDAALLRFHDFLKNLPAGVQLFSLFNLNPQLLSLIATILGSAPALSEQLSKNPALLDIVLYDDFYETLPGKEILTRQLNDLARTAYDYEERMDKVRQFRNEKQFQAGVHFIKHMISAAQAGLFLSDLAEVALQYTFDNTLEEFTQKYGKVPGSSFSVLALGKLGSREMTFASDIDLVFIYHTTENNSPVDDEKEYAASVYYNRFAQRLLTAITGMSRNGRLYEVDTRLRPSGRKGLLTVDMAALNQYFSASAWTFEYMALSKARPVIGNKQARLELTNFVNKQLAKKRDKTLLKKHVIDMRQRIDKEHGSKNPWDIKYVRGGLVDLDFIAQYMLLFYAPESPPPYPGSTPTIFAWLKEKSFISDELADELIAQEFFLSQVFHIIRLCYSEHFNEDDVPFGLKKLLCDTLKLPSFEVLKEQLLSVEKQVLAHYLAMVESNS